MVQVVENKQAETYSTVDTVYTKIMEIADDAVTGMCMLNQEDGKFEKRLYPAHVLSELNLKEGDVIAVTLYTKPGEIKSTYERADDFDGFETFKREKIYFQGLENSPLFQPLPSEE